VPSRLTTSSFAVLCLLAIRPWSAYELTQQATRSLRFAWPKSERLLYSEPKKLVEHGMATAHQESVGGRSRTVYTITDEGRTALRHWMATEPQPPVLEAEALLRLLFADLGTIDDATVALDELAADAADTYDQVLEINAGYLDGQHPFPDRVHVSVLFATFQLEFLDLIVRWAEFARTEIGAWPTTEGLGMTARTREILEAVTRHRSVLDGSRRTS
jgi:DNA-binding PadR family transcriptional regulator